MAQTRSTDIPAEFPPPDYEGRQYVDSRGCVYVRAGIDGSTTWVPRVSRSREPVCGAQPSLPGGGGIAAGEDRLAEAEEITLPTAEPAPVPEPRVAAVTPVRATAPQRRAAPVTRPAVSAGSAALRVPPSKPATTAPRTVAHVPATKIERVSPEPRPIVLSSGQGACIETGPAPAGYALRCRPAEPAPAAVLRDAGPLVPSGYAYKVRVDSSRHPVPSPYTRIVPRHVYEARDDTLPRIPPGYRPAWEDDRLNRHRANMSLGGYRKTQLTWTNTVPRELVPRNQPVRIKEPILLYRR